MQGDRDDRTAEGPTLAQPTYSVWPRARGVLIIEADPDLQWRLARALTIEGHRVVGTSSGEGALALLAEWNVDLAVVDEDLPGMDGLEVVRRICARQPGVPVVLVSGEDGPDVQVAARLAGAVRCLRKPVAKGALFEVVRLLGGTDRAAE